MENDERQERLRKLKQNRVDEYEDRIQIKGDQWFAATTGILVVLLFGINIAKGRTSYELLTVAFLPYAVRYLFMYKKISLFGNRVTLAWTTFLCGVSDVGIRGTLR